MDDGYTQTHDLTRDRQYVERLQLASVKASEFALASLHDLFGSGRWWEAVCDGSIPTHRVEGTIVDVRINGNWPEFEVLAEEEPTTWPRGRRQIVLCRKRRENQLRDSALCGSQWSRRRLGEGGSEDLGGRMTRALSSGRRMAPQV